MEPQKVNNISESLTTSLTKLFKAGGLTLVFVFVGLITMLLGHFYKSNLSIYLFIVGTVITFSCLGLNIYIQLKLPYKALKTVNSNKQVIDELQSISIQLIHLIYVMQSFSFKYINTLNKIIEKIYDIVISIPVVGAKIENRSLKDIKNISKLILDTTNQSEEVVKAVEQALIQGNLNLLKKQSKAIKNAIDILNESLKGTINDQSSKSS